MTARPIYRGSSGVRVKAGFEARIAAVRAGTGGRVRRASLADAMLGTDEPRLRDQIVDQRVTAAFH